MTSAETGRRTVVQLMALLRGLDVAVSVRDGRLRCEGPPGAISESLRAEIAERKAEIVHHLERTPETLIPPVGHKGPLPLSFPQQRLWFLDQFEGGNTAYIVFSAFRLRGKLNVTALERSLAEIVRRHDSLRTVFLVADGVPLQKTAAFPPFVLPVTDLAEVEDRVRASRLAELTAAQATQPFDLAHGPLFRAHLFRWEPDVHVLLLAMHHIISDGWSLGVLQRELGTLYDAFCVGRPSPLPELPIQYADFSMWQRARLDSGFMAADLAYWKAELAGAPPLLMLPYDQPRPARQTYGGAWESVSLPEQLCGALRKLSVAEGVSPFMLMLAAFQVLLHRYSGQQEICVGIPTACRTTPEVEQLIGFFANTLVLRADLGGRPPFQEFLAAVRAKALEAYAHQELPFEKLVEVLAPERSLSHPPLFQVAVIGRNEPGRPPMLTGLQVEPLPANNSTAKFDLTLVVDTSAPSFLCEVEYNTALFEAGTIRRLLGHYQSLLGAVVEDPGRSVASLPLLTSAERREMLLAWNDTARPYPRVSISRLIADRASATPDSVAVSFQGASLTFAELERRSNRLARHLRSLGAGSGTLVGILLERSLDVLVGLLGILKAGAAYVPLDPAYPADRIGFMLEDSEAPLLLTHGALADSLAPVQARIVRIDADWPAIALESGDSLPDGPGPDDLAYVIYTSGSTGKPKGTQIRHASVVNFLCSMAREPGFTSQDRLLSVTTLSFDIAGLEFYLPLVQGGTLAIASRDETTDPRLLQQAMASFSPTVVQATPATWMMLLDAGWKGDPGLKILCGGEALPPGLAEQLLTRGESVWNLYGPTETTIWSTVHRVCVGERPVPIGRSIDNTWVYVLDDQLQPVPVGVPGELYIGGHGVAVGYLRRPDLTAEKFLPDPFRGDGSKMYRTGDLVRFRPGGLLEYLGRLDDQIKVRGHRVELGEISAVLGRHPGVKQVCVLDAGSTPDEHTLTAYVVPAADGSLEEQALREHLRRSLPAFMVPSQFVFLDALPLTPNGKIDRRRLAQELAPHKEKGEADRITYRDSVEYRLTRIWESVLRVQPIGVTDDFFEIGGHSLLAARLLAKIESAFQERLPLTTLFEAPTIEKMAARLRGGSAPKSFPGAFVIQPFGSKAPFFQVGSYLNFRHLRLRLGSERPLFGVPGPDPEELNPPYRLEDLAAYHVKVIRDLQPEGPYHVGGWCLHGVVALEVAQQLLRLGQQVALLVLFDTHNPSTLTHVAKAEVRRILVRGLLESSRFHLATLRSLPSQARAAYLRERLETLAFKLDAAVWEKQYSLRTRFGASNPGKSRSIDQIIYIAARSYEPQPYPHPAVLFRPQLRYARHHDGPLFGWENVIPGLTVEDVPGGHIEMFEEPNVAVVAAKLRERLASPGRDSAEHEQDLHAGPF